MSAVRNIANTSGRCRPNVCWFTGYCFYIWRLNSIRVLLLCVISFTVSFRAVIIPSLEALREPESGNSSMRTRLPQPFPAVKAGVQAAPSFSLVVRESRTYFRWSTCSSHHAETERVRNGTITFGQNWKCSFLHMRRRNRNWNLVDLQFLSHCFTVSLGPISKMLSEEASAMCFCTRSVTLNYNYNLGARGMVDPFFSEIGDRTIYPNVRRM